ncbi:MAG: DUF378 domain-containing protein [Chlamydiales bacterium]|nr:DUF378 domain-containing protein [Chlamydiales bacterium]
MKIVDGIAKALLIIAGLNWGTVGVADFNGLMWVFITMPMVQHLLYTSFGLAAIWVVARACMRK